MELELRYDKSWDLYNDLYNMLRELGFKVEYDDYKKTKTIVNFLVLER